MSEMLKHARFYIDQGWKVLPLWGIKDGHCGCGKPDCGNQGKHPYHPFVPHGVKDASAKLDVIEDWFDHEELNIGICTGTESGLVVLDVDPRHGGDVAIKAYEVPETPTVITGGDGLHYYFRHPGGDIRNSAGVLGPGLDIRAHNGYVVGPPSMHLSGQEYQWHLMPNTVELANCPGWVIQQKKEPVVSVTDVTGQIIPKGKRDETLASLAGTMRHKGMTEKEILAALLETNRSRCQPPLPDKDVRRIAKSIGKYAPKSADSEPILIRMADVPAREIDWLWHGRIALGRITLLVGRPGEGKSFLTTYMASRVTTGSPWPDGAPCPKGSVILISAEDDPGDTIRPRLDAHLADVNHVHLLSMVKRSKGGKTSEVMFTLADLAALEAALQRVPDCKLLVIDPIGSFLGGRTDAHRDNEVRGILAPVAKMAEQYGPAVVIVAHRRKTSGSVADDLALGSRAFTGIARMVWHMMRHPEKKALRLLLPGKNNLAAEGGGLAFTIHGDPPALAWARGTVDMTADDALAKENESAKSGPEPTARNQAAEWLKDLLSGRSMPVGDYKKPEPGTIAHTAKEAGYSWGTLRRAKDLLGIIPYRDEFAGHWRWKLPDQDAQADEQSVRGEQLEQPEHLGDYEPEKDICEPTI